jgi:hypothetical protein
MSSASTTAGSPIVVIRPTMTISAPPDLSVIGLLVSAGAPSAEQDGEVGEPVTTTAQPAPKASRTSNAERRPNLVRDVDIRTPRCW